MKLIDASYEIWEQEPGIQGIYKQIERAGKTCYHATDNITENSAEKFVDRLIKMQHFSPLEHGSVYLYFKHDEYKEGGVDMGDPYNVSLNLTLNPYTVSNHNWEAHETFYTTNLRVIVELLPNDWKDFLKTHAVDYDERFIPRPTVYFTCDRFTGESFIRHRKFSFARESTRYCNYSKDKFNNEITFIRPLWCEKEVAFTKEPKAELILESQLSKTEKAYFDLLDMGWKPQQARVVLPCAIKSPLVMTGVIPDWKHFFDLRAFDKTGPAHPQAKELTLPLYNEFVEKGWINEEKA